MTADRGPTFPFTAIVGQERMKLALLLAAVDPGIGGVLIRGHKGTAKSTAVRALASVLPPIEVVDGCPFSCHPRAPQGLCGLCQGDGPPPATVRPARLVDLPMGATEDRVLGTLDIEAALKEGERRFQPGLLAQAHRGVLYIDEVNLLPDHLVDVLLDAAAMGINYVEREGVSFSHQARFVLVGTMNPEEGEVRPQLLDRFGLAAEVEELTDPALRAEVVRRRLEFDRDPEGFLARWRPEEEALRRRLADAQALLPSVRAEEGLLEHIAGLCLAHRVEGMRADIVIYRAALAHAALNGRRHARAEDVEAVAPLALLHRGRPPEGPSPAFPPPPPPPADTGHRPSPGPGGAGGERHVPPAPSAAPSLLLKEDRPPPSPRLGRRAVVTGVPSHGRYVSARLPRGRVADLALDATLRAAAQRGARVHRGLGLRLRPEDLRVKVREGRVGALLAFVVDASGSMAARHRLAAVKGAALELLADAYRRRDRVAVVCARGSGAQVVLPPTGSLERARRLLTSLPAGGATPLAAGLARAAWLLERHRRTHPRAPCLLVLATDGRANRSLHGGDPYAEAIAQAEALRQRGFKAVVLDVEGGAPFSLGLTRGLARALGAPCVPVGPGDGQALARAIRVVLR
ncbi:MAG TPA: magnesium chelatase subunit D family protein [Dehalococcoidia bacterium]|nr:magnesium chelatase subunit D family protein [Dehalococcoidia bacterium]